MPSQHGSNSRYVQGCRCSDCREGHRHAARDYAQRKAGVPNGTAWCSDQQESAPTVPNGTPGPVELGVQAELDGVVDRPGLIAAALAMARLLDDPTAKNQAPAAAKTLVAVLEKLRSDSARQRRGGLALVRTMTEKGGT
jgi:hypothetical protein